MDMTPEEKNRKLEELRKELDPDVLSKMADYLGGGGNDGSSNQRMSGSVDTIRDKQAARFQERVAMRKLENQKSEAAESKLKDLKTVMVFCRNEFWARIVGTQFKNLGFFEPVIFSEFGNLVRALGGSGGEDSMDPCAVVLPYQEFEYFLPLWETLRQRDAEKKLLPKIHAIPFLVVVESEKQISAELDNKIGAERIINLMDNVTLNLEKIARAALMQNGN